MTEEELRLLQDYLIARSVPGRSASQRVNLLQDAGFDLFNDYGPFERQQFVEEPEPFWVNPIEETYRNDPGYQEMFRMIEEDNVAPEVAAQQLIDAGYLKGHTPGDEGASDPRVVARMFMQREVENAVERDKWRRSQDIARQKFEREQSTAEREYERDRPYTMEDLRGISQLEQFGNPSLEELGQVRTQSRENELNKLAASRVARRQASGQPIVTPMGANLSSSRAIQNVDPLANSPKARAAFERGLAMKRGEMAATRVPTERTERAMRNLAYLGMLGV